MDPPSTVDWIARNLLPGLGPIATRRALERWGHPAEIAYRVPPGELRALGRIAAKDLAELPMARRDLRRRAERELERAGQGGIAILPFGHPDYPAELSLVATEPIRPALWRARSIPK